MGTRPRAILVLAALASGCHEDPPPDPPSGGRILAGPLVGRGLAVAPRPGGDELWISAPDIDGSGGVYRLDHRGGRLADAAVALVGGEPDAIGDGFAACDLDGDSTTDLVLGAPQQGGAGGVWWLPGPPGGTSSVLDAPFVPGFRDEGHSGAVVGCGDLDADGLDDVAVSAPDTDSGGLAVRTGTIDLHRSTPSGPSKFANIDTTWSDSHLGFRTGVVIGADLDGDGTGDLALGGWGADRIHLVFGPVAGSLYTNSSGLTLSGPLGEGTGHAIAAGDIDGDGHDDLVVGAPLAAGEQGAVWLLPGPFDPEAPADQIERYGTRLDGVGEGDQAGFSVAIPGDLDGDGAEDMLIGAPFAGGIGPEAGAAYVVHGPGDLRGTLDEADALLLGEIARGRLGWAVAGGDLDGDGRIEIAVSAPEADVDGVVGVGAVYVFPGDVSGVRYPDTATARIDR